MFISLPTGFGKSIICSILVGSSHVIINIFTIVGGSEKNAGSWEVRCVAGTASALLQSGVRRHFIRRTKSP